MLDQGYCHPKLKEKGSICVRKGCTKACPSGTGWEFVIGVRKQLSTMITHKQHIPKLTYKHVSTSRVDGVSSATEALTFHTLKYVI